MSVEFKFWDEPGKHGGICFETRQGQAKETFMANRAIEEVMEDAGMRPFHQVGWDGLPGVSAWEVWVSVTRAEIEALIPKVVEHFEAFMAESF